MKASETKDYYAIVKSIVIDARSLIEERCAALEKNESFLIYGRVVLLLYQLFFKMSVERADQFLEKKQAELSKNPDQVSE